MKELVTIYPKLLVIAFKSKMQYRSDFLIGIISTPVANAANLLLIWVLLRRFHALMGWTYWEMVMLYSMWLLIHSTYATLFWHLSSLEDDINSGNFDRYLSRPCNTFIQFLGKEINYMGIGDMMIGAVVFSMAYGHLALQWDIWRWLFFVSTIIAGLYIEVSIVLLFGILSFWTGRSHELFRLSLRFNLLTQQYPIDIFGRWYQVFVTAFLPLAFINYYPLCFLLDKNNALNSPLLSFLSPIAAAILITLAAMFWHVGIRSYTSSGN